MILVHTIGGAAGNFRIESIYQIAKNIETIIRSNQQVSPELLVQFATSVTETMQVLADINIETPKFTKTKTNALLKLLAELTILLKTGNFQATDLLSEIQNNLGEDLQTFYYDLEEQVNNFEFTAD